MDGATIHKLFGTADNSGEPEPLVNKKGTILGVVISFAVFSWLCVGFRMHVRAKVVRSLGWDDLFVVLSLLSITTGSVGICIGKHLSTVLNTSKILTMSSATKYGMGKHIYQLSAEQVQGYLRMSTAFIKISLLFQYLRIFDQPSFTRRLCIFTITFVCLWAITYAFLGWVPCIPLKAYWDWSVPASRWAYGSLNAEVFSATYESHSAVNISLDLLVLAIPVPLYFKQNAPLKSRLGLLALLAIGIAVNGVSIVRFITILQHRSATYPTLDFPWYGPVSIVLACVEVDLAMVASSVPIFWPVLRQKFPGIFVTKEVEVTREARRLESVELDDDIGTEEGRRSRVGSEASLRQENRGAGVRYMDEFVANQVDPLRRSKSVVTEVKAGELDVDGGWWKTSR
ncbi:integral membrane protein [Colletotrichum tofieldiae]|nr:integral membrane protein [Colletotrichum tofieldiae]GKT70243.1 integral membrane protein [Colletotrichum tofieldiae]